MALSPGEEFRLNATPDPELRRKLDYLAQIGSAAVLTPGAGERPGSASSFRRAASAQTFEMIRMARLAEPDYQAMSVRINDDLGRMDERAVGVLQKIEQALTELRLRRERFLQQTYKDENGRPIAPTRDGTAAYYVDESGGQVDNETFLQIRELLIGRPPVEEFSDIKAMQDDLNAYRDKIHLGMADGEQLRDDLAAGAVSEEDAERRLQEVRETNTAVLDAAEAALLGARDGLLAPDGAAPDDAGTEAVPLMTPPKPR